MRQIDFAPSIAPASASTGCSTCSTPCPASMPAQPPTRPTTSSGSARTIPDHHGGGRLRRGRAHVDVKEQTLNVRAEKKAEDKERQFLHRGIATRAFERRFQLADHVEVKGADLKDGLLHVDLVRNVPERLKPRSVAIGNGKAAAKQVEASV